MENIASKSFYLFSKYIGLRKSISRVVVIGEEILIESIAGVYKTRTDEQIDQRVLIKASEFMSIISFFHLFYFQSLHQAFWRRKAFGTFSLLRAHQSHAPINPTKPNQTKQLLALLPHWWYCCHCRNRSVNFITFYIYTYSFSLFMTIFCFFLVGFFVG